MDERVEARQALAPVHGHVRLMTQQLEEFGVDVPDERLILDHEHLHFFVDPVLVNVSSRRGVGRPTEYSLNARGTTAPVIQQVGRLLAIQERNAGRRLGSLPATL